MFINMFASVSFIGKLLLISIIISLSLDIFLTNWIKCKSPDLKNRYFTWSIKVGLIKATLIKSAIALLLIYSILAENLNTFKLILPVSVHFIFVIIMLIDFLGETNILDG